MSTVKYPPAIARLLPAHTSEPAPSQDQAAACVQMRAKPRALAFQDILVAVDHSGHTALQAAIALVSATEGRIVVIHVVESEPAGTGYIAKPKRSEAEDPSHIFSVARAVMPSTIEAEYYLCYGNAAEEITQFASQRHPDLIIIGMCPLRPVDVGSNKGVARNVLHCANCPVMLVPDIELVHHRVHP